VTPRNSASAELPSLEAAPVRINVAPGRVWTLNLQRLPCQGAGPPFWVALRLSDLGTGWG
jgi:hypothetical protein